MIYIAASEIVHKLLLHCQSLRVNSHSYSCHCNNQRWALGQIPNPQILGLIPLSKVRTPFRCASPQIAKPKICMIHQQIANSQISTKYCTTLSQNALKASFQTIFCTNLNLNSMLHFKFTITWYTYKTIKWLHDSVSSILYTL